MTVEEKLNVIDKYRSAQEIRFLPHDKTTFPSLNTLLSFLKGTLVKRGGIYYYPQKAMNCSENALVLFQYAGKLVGSAMLLKRIPGECFDELGNRYDGHYVFDMSTLLLFGEITAAEYDKFIDPGFGGFSRAMKKTDISKLGNLISLLKSKYI